MCILFRWKVVNLFDRLYCTFSRAQRIYLTVKFHTEIFTICLFINSYTMLFKFVAESGRHFLFPTLWQPVLFAYIYLEFTSLEFTHFTYFVFIVYYEEVEQYIIFKNNFKTNFVRKSGEAIAWFVCRDGSTVVLHCCTAQKIFWIYIIKVLLYHFICLL